MTDPTPDATPALPVRDVVARMAPFLRSYAVAPFALVIDPQASPRERWEVRGDRWFRCAVASDDDRPDNQSWAATAAEAAASPNLVGLTIVYHAWSVLFARTQDLELDVGWRQAAFIWMNNAYNALSFIAGGSLVQLSDVELRVARENRDRAHRMTLRARFHV
ncbi:hypothetical protein Q9R19_02070 [Microbacterium sp. ARD32]|uniref:hypothetical protein n=1 Tax=Microbacterium sp. ARD32 TaxID=2962577 RepID=UPI002881B217|nr:hypothetical protein [Microbacterium sp. ARD32]MDT0156403.1 hypothetical protein [Microbacterium sp. ARD32]